MNYREKKQQHIDAEGFRLLGCIEVNPFIKREQISPNLQGSIHNKIAVDITDKMIDSPAVESETDDSGILSKREIYNDISRGLNREEYQKLKKLASVAYNERSIKEKISEKFIEDKIFEWLLKTHKDSKAEKTLSTFLLDEFSMVQKHLRIRFPITNLDIDGAFEIGKVKFDFFSKNYFDRFADYNDKSNAKTTEETEDYFRKKYQGMVFVYFDAHAESKRAEEIALEYCSLSMDVLKMCSDTLDFPEMILGFDIDSRLTFPASSEVLISNVQNDVEGVNINYYGPKTRHRIGQNEFNRMQTRGLQTFHSFLLLLSDDPSELEALLVNSIKRYGNAISSRNLHQRIVELFTILESLLLLDTNMPIIESVCKYCSKLVFREVEDRKQVIELLKDLYNVRSKLIHHGKEVDFEISALRKLQYIVVMLIEVLIKKTGQHKHKTSLLQEIEDAIMRAYL
ncbi:MAG: hypothetical protein EOO90_13885 [Pedobacter sp.]|nr:MAG: hypothetical protein EOO90_13885 [Pedobacter sp.]